MKTLLILALITPLSAMANGSSGTRGGGDLCEDQIKIIRDDLKSWLKTNSPGSLTLPTSTSLAQYSASMLGSISTAKIRCVRAGDAGYPVNINGTPKICMFDSGSDQITCDFDKFRELSNSDQYVLVHHEYAGLAGLEVPHGDDSDYSISNQITNYLGNQSSQRLGVKGGGISVSTTSSFAHGEGDAARRLIQALKDAGITGVKTSGEEEDFEIKGQIFATTGFCGSASYQVDLTSLNDDGKVLQLVTLPGFQENCASISPAQKFATLMLQWGALPFVTQWGLSAILWPTIDKISCLHTDASNGKEAYDNCSVRLTAPY